MTTRLQLDFPSMSDARFSRRPTSVSGAGLLAWMRAALTRWQQRRVLCMLDERMLHDIGISRSQALAEAGKPFWRG